MICSSKLGLHDSILPVLDHGPDSQLRPEVLRLLVELLVLGQLRELLLTLGNRYGPVNEHLLLR